MGNIIFSLNNRNVNLGYLKSWNTEHREKYIKDVKLIWCTILDINEWNKNVHFKNNLVMKNHKIVHETKSVTSPKLHY